MVSYEPYDNFARFSTTQGLTSDMFSFETRTAGRGEVDRDVDSTRVHTGEVDSNVDRDSDSDANSDADNILDQRKGATMSLEGGQIKISFDEGVNPDDFFRALMADKRYAKDPSSVKLKNPPVPYTGPEPKVTLPDDCFPHILEKVIKAAEVPALLALRATCKRALRLVDRVYAYHIQLHTEVNDLDISARWLGRIPSIRFRGPITLGVATTTEAEAAVNPNLRDQIPVIPGPNDPHEVWLRVPAKDKAWLNGFMKHVVVLDLDGSSWAVLNTLSKSQQMSCDPHSRIAIDGYTVPLLRMFPDSHGSYFVYNPFKATTVQQSIQFESGSVLSRTWLGHTPPAVPEGTKQFQAAIHIAPDLAWGPQDMESTNWDPVIFPSSIRRIVVTPLMHPRTAKPTPKSFMSLSGVWSKLFGTVSPNNPLQFWIINIHQWDDVMPLDPRHIITKMYAHKFFDGNIPDDMEQVSRLTWPYLRFIREPNPDLLGNYSEEPMQWCTVNPDGTHNEPMNEFPEF